MEQNEVKTDSGFDKEAWLEQKRADRKETFDLIDVTADSLTRNAELFQTCLDVMSKFDRYSVGNILLLTAQNPNATHLACANRIYGDMTYHLKKAPKSQTQEVR